jgi:hypothetical protein
MRMRLQFSQRMLDDSTHFTNHGVVGVHMAVNLEKDFLISKSVEIQRSVTPVSNI